MSGEVLVLDRPQTRLPAADGSVVAPLTSETSERTAGERVGPHWTADYFELAKPRIVMMILIVTAMSAVVAAGRDLQWMPLLHLMLGTALVAGSAGVLNQVMEKEVDGRMARTRHRPLPRERVSRTLAALYGIVLVVAGTFYLNATVGWTPALVGVATWLLYVVVYTPLKTRTQWNTTVGAIAGALPMLMGYTAAGGTLADVRGWLLFAVMMLWQFPHFMAIAWMYRYDYGSAGLKMTPVVEPTGKSAGWQAVIGSLLLVATLVALVLPHAWGWFFSLLAIAVTAKFVISSFQFAFHPDDMTARRLFLASLVQLPAAMLVLVASSLI